MSEIQNPDDMFLNEYHRQQSRRMVKYVSEQPERRPGIDVIGSVHRTSKAAQGAAEPPRTPAEENTLNKALRIGEDKLLRRWAIATNCLLPEEPFTVAWQ